MSIEAIQSRICTLCNLVVALDPSVHDSISHIVELLDECSSLLAASQSHRYVFGQAADPAPWPVLRELWQITADVHKQVGLEAEQSATLCLSVARVTRNLVAGVPSNQEKAWENEPIIRKLVHQHTSFSVMQDAHSFATTRMLVQALSNIVTANDSLSQKLWMIYTQLPQEESIIIRLCASPDIKTVSATFILMLNLIHGSQERAKLLFTSATGSRLCISLLDHISSLFDIGESTDESQAYDIGYQIFARLFEGGLFPGLYSNIAVTDEVIAPHQTTLLKLLDSYLQSSPSEVVKKSDELLRMLILTFLQLSLYAQTSIRRALDIAAPPPNTNISPSANARAESALSPGLSGSNTERPGDQGLPPLKEVDLLLPKVCEALVLVAQCLCSIMLASEADTHSEGMSSTVPRHSDGSRALREYFSDTNTSNGQGIVENLIETLRLLDVFIPRVTFGKVVQRPSPPGTDARQEQPNPPQLGFAYIKRDLVRLLGILSDHNRPVQDRVRISGGIPIIMNMCVVDDQNPYLKEHAVFALRNILRHNQENQSVINEIQPTGRWDETGFLRNIQSVEP